MTYSMRCDLYTATDHYWIRFYNGTCQVRKATPEWETDNETVFEGKYEDCVAFIKELEIADLESRF